MGRKPYSHRLTVEECKSVSTKFLRKHHYFDGGLRFGGLKWSVGDRANGSINIEVSTNDEAGYIRFRYISTDLTTRTKEKFDYKAKLSWSPCFFGGRRWWFICPLMKGTIPCNRRVGVLYLANGKYFGCRHCYNLTYQSSKEHDKRVDALKKNPELMLSYINEGSFRHIMLASKALFKTIGRYN